MLHFGVPVSDIIDLFPEPLIVEHN
jgi:hypothetical protein